MGIEGYDEIVTFGHVLARIFAGSECAVESLLAYFEKPHKWEAEYQQWRKLGGTLDAECLDEFEKWYEAKLLGCQCDSEVGYICQLCQMEKAEAMAGL